MFSLLKNNNLYAFKNILNKNLLRIQKNIFSSLIIGIFVPSLIDEVPKLYLQLNCTKLSKFNSKCYSINFITTFGEL